MLSLVLSLAISPLATGSEPEAPASLVFTAGELPALAGGLAVPRSGEYTLKVWTDGRHSWPVATEGRALAILPPIDREDGDRRPRWEALGKFRLSSDSADPLGVPASPVPLPAILSLSTDPDFVPGRALDILRGNAKATDPPVDPRRAEVRTNQQGADFEPPASPEAWRGRSEAVRRQILVTLGLWPMPPKTDLHPRVVGTLDRDGYAIDKVVLETLPGFYLAGNLYRPSNRPGRLPVVLCPHGHAKEGRVDADVQSRCVRLAQLGCVVFLYDMVGFADGRPFGHAFLDDRLRRWGLSLATLQTWNSVRALDWLTARPDVDPARVAVTGESGGAIQTLLLTAIDPRVKVSAPVVMVSDSFQGGCACENSAGLRHGTDNVEFAALAAPRAMKIVGATGDWTARTMTNALPSIQAVYAQSGGSDRLGADVFDFPHNYNKTSREAVYAFLGRWFLGIDDPATTTREGPIRVESASDLLAFDAEGSYPADAKTPAQLEAELVGVLGRQLDRLAPGTVAATWEAARDKLGVALKVRVGVENPTPRQTAAKRVREVEREGLKVDHHVVGRRATRESIPVVRLTPAKANGRLTVIFSGRGKAALTTAEGDPSPMAKALIERGQSVVGLDPLLIGESLDPEKPAASRPSTVHFDTYNSSLAADRAQDLATVLSWARALPDVLEVNLVADATIGPLALLARPSLEGIGRAAIDLGGFDPGDGSGPIPPGLDLPGMLQFGALKGAAALSAPSPLWIAGAGGGFADSWPVKAYALADAPGQFRLDRGPVDPAAVARWIDSGE